MLVNLSKLYNESAEDEVKKEAPPTMSMNIMGMYGQNAMGNGMHKNYNITPQQFLSIAQSIIGQQTMVNHVQPTKQIAAQKNQRMINLEIC